MLSTQDQEAIREGKAKFDLPFTFVSDANGALVDALALRDAGHGPKGTDVFFPTVFLLDRAGVVRWKHVSRNVRDRAEPEEILAAVGAIAS